MVYIGIQYMYVKNSILKKCVAYFTIICLQTIFPNNLDILSYLLGKFKFIFLCQFLLYMKITLNK